MSDQDDSWTVDAKERHRQIGLDWITDSRLERWFPFTAKELDSLRARVKELEEKLKIAVEELEYAGDTFSMADDTYSYRKITEALDKIQS